MLSSGFSSNSQPFQVFSAYININTQPFFELDLWILWQMALLGRESSTQKNLKIGDCKTGLQICARKTFSETSRHGWFFVGGSINIGETRVWWLDSGQNLFFLP